MWVCEYVSFHPHTHAPTHSQTITPPISCYFRQDGVIKALIGGLKVHPTFHLCIRAALPPSPRGADALLTGRRPCEACSASGLSGSGTGVAKAMPCQEPSRSTNARPPPFPFRAFRVFRGRKILLSSTNVPTHEHTPSSRVSVVHSSTNLQTYQRKNTRSTLHALRCLLFKITGPCQFRKWAAAWRPR